MNIKSLLLGSAAVLAAVSGARAADAVVVAEPEPMEYVRICDVYGAGYYYIPGTETCLKIGGYVRYEIQFDDEDDGWDKLARAELTFTAKSETEYGTLTGHIDLRGDVESGDLADDEVAVQHAWISLAGLQMGLSDTLYDGDLGGEFDSGGGDRVHFIRYNWVGGNGISVSVGLEEDTQNDNYMPNVVARVGIEQGWGSVTLFAAYDSEDDAGRTSLNPEDEFALKAIASFKATEQLTLEVLATYESGASFYSLGFVPGLTNAALGMPADVPVAIGYEYSFGGYAKFAVNNRLTIGAGGQYFANLHAAAAGVVEAKSGLDDWSVGAVVAYKIAENFDAKLAVNYSNGATFDDIGDDNGVFSGFLRFDRSF